MAPVHCLSWASAPPSPPSLPCLYPKLRSGCPRSLRRPSHPPGFTDPGWGAGRSEGVGSGGGGRSGNRETTDGRYPGGSRGLKKKGRLEETEPEETGASDSAGHLWLLGAWAPQKDPRCGGVRGGEASRRAQKHVEVLHDLLGHCLPEVLSLVHSPRWQRWLET